MIRSAKPREQRWFRFNAPMHARQHFLHVHVDKALREKLKIKQRAVQLSRGDTVKVVSGGRRGLSGKVMSVSLRTGRITLASSIVTLPWVSTPTLYDLPSFLNSRTSFRPTGYLASRTTLVLTRTSPPLMVFDASDLFAAIESFSSANCSGMLRSLLCLPGFARMT